MLFLMYNLFTSFSIPHANPLNVKLYMYFQPIVRQCESVISGLSAKISRNLKWIWCICVRITKEIQDISKVFFIDSNCYLKKEEIFFFHKSRDSIRWRLGTFEKEDYLYIIDDQVGDAYSWGINTHTRCYCLRIHVVCLVDLVGQDSPVIIHIFLLECLQRFLQMKRN